MRGGALGLKWGWSPGAIRVSRTQLRRVVATRRTLPLVAFPDCLRSANSTGSDAMGNWTYRFAVDMSTPTGSVGQAIGVSLASETSGEFEASQAILASNSSLAPAPG